jgi:Rrf2 family protein
MNILFSRRCEYAIRAILYLARKPRGMMVSIREFTEKLDIPYHYLAKILQDLTRRKILESHRGASGGYSLAQSADEITLIRVVEAIDGEALMKSCVLGFPECSSQNPCSLHELWKRCREGILGRLESENIASLASRMEKPEYSG